MHNLSHNLLQLNCAINLSLQLVCYTNDIRGAIILSYVGAAIPIASKGERLRGQKHLFSRLIGSTNCHLRDHFSARLFVPSSLLKMCRVRSSTPGQQICRQEKEEHRFVRPYTQENEDSTGDEKARQADPPSIHSQHPHKLDAPM